MSAAHRIRRLLTGGYRTRTSVTRQSVPNGFSLIEMLVAAVLLGIFLVGLAPAFHMAARQGNDGRADTRMWAAVHDQMEQLTAQGYDDVSDSSATVGSLAMSWTVQAGGPKRVMLVVTDHRPSRTVTDTFVTYIADPD